MGSTPTFRITFSEGKCVLSERSESKDKPAALASGWCCYLLLCQDGTYYCGIASNLSQRVKNHGSGKGSGYTKENKPVALVWYEAHGDRHSAARRENQLKKWSHSKKKSLAEGRLEVQGSAKAVWVSLD